MIGLKIKNGFIDLSKTTFNCTACGKEYTDSNDKYLNRCNKNKSTYTSIKCSCSHKFNMTYNMMGEAVSFD